MAVKRSTSSPTPTPSTTAIASKSEAMPDQSIHLSVYSPPFAGRFTTTSPVTATLSNNPTTEAFFDHYDSWWNRSRGSPCRANDCGALHGRSHRQLGQRRYIDFPGDIIRQHAKFGFDYVADGMERAAGAQQDDGEEPRTQDRRREIPPTPASADYLPGSASVERPGTQYRSRTRQGVRVPGERKMPPELLAYRGWQGNRPRTAIRTGSGDSTRRRSGMTSASEAGAAVQGRPP